MTHCVQPERRAIPHPGNHSIHAAFLRCASLHPRRVAIVCGDTEISYAELAGRAAKVAHQLRQNSILPGQIVGLCVQRSPDAVAAMLGVLAVGAAYLPFDPAYPAALLERVYGECDPAIMLVDDSAEWHRERPFWRHRSLSIAAMLQSSGADGGDDSLSIAAKPDDLAYVMYTSGSTGMPKGVMVPCRAILRLVEDNVFAKLADETFLQLAPLSFDASTFEIWAPLLNGSRLAILPGPIPRSTRSPPRSHAMM